MKNYFLNLVLGRLFRHFEIRRKTTCRDYIELGLSSRQLLKSVVVQELSMTSIDNLTFTTLACQDMIENQIAGDFVEVGVWRGGHLIAAHPFHAAKRQIIGIDTFAGMTTPNSQEHNLRTLKKASERKLELTQGKGWRPYRKHEVEEGILRIDPTIFESIKLFEGDVTQAQFQSEIIFPEAISILRIDVDWYQPTLSTLEIFWDLVTVGGIVIFDDYGSWSGTRDAAKTFFQKRGLNLTFFPINETSRYVVKY